MKYVFLIFCLALFLRLLYFPNDINFAYDQARDAFVSLKVAHGDFITVGPPTTFFGIHHGSLFYYLFAPFYLLSNGSPLPLSFLLRILNSCGVFLVFLIAKNMFNKKSAIIASLIYAFSFEETQFSLFLAHPSPAGITSLVFFWGITEVIFNKKEWGLLVAALGLSLSTQFHFSMFILFLPAILYLFVFKKSFQFLSKKTYFFSALIIIFFMATFIYAELKFGFGNAKHSLEFAQSLATKNGTFVETLIKVIARYFRHNFINLNYLYDINIVIFLVISFSVSYIFLKKEKQKILFLLIWFVSGLLTFLPDNPIQPRYVSAMGTSISLIILFSFLLSKIKNKALLIFLISSICVSNFLLIRQNNPFGTISEVNAQERMLLSDEKALLDYIYTSQIDESFSVNAVTIPYKINTTWSYLFEWYGMSKYNNLPLWAGDNALGFEGNLKLLSKRSEGPNTHYLIIEPSRGISENLIREFIENENNFTKVIEEKQFGKLIVQKRTRY